MRLIPKRSEDPRVTSKIRDYHGLNALDSDRPNSEGTAAISPPLRYRVSVIIKARLGKLSQ